MCSIIIAFKNGGTGMPVIGPIAIYISRAISGTEIMSRFLSDFSLALSRFKLAPSFIP